MVNRGLLNEMWLGEVAVRSQGRLNGPSPCQVNLDSPCWSRRWQGLLPRLGKSELWHRGHIGRNDGNPVQGLGLKDGTC
jgi:hypothetical protein